MPKKPTRRKRQRGERQARRHRTERRHLAPGPPAPPGDADRERLLAELQEVVRAAIREHELANTEPDDNDDDIDDDVWNDEHEDGYLPDGPYDFEPEASRIVLDTMDEILATGVARAAYDTDRRLAAYEHRHEFELCSGDGPLIGEIVAVSILLELRYAARPDPAAAVRWVSERFGAEHGRQALRVADLLGHSDAPPWSGVHPARDGAEPLLPALVLLLAGVAGITLADHLP